MKFSTGAIAVLLGRLTGVFAMDTEPTSNQLTFNPDTVISYSFSIRRFNDERVQTFRLLASVPDIELTYAFRSDGRLTSFRITAEDPVIADERFRVSYNAQTGDILGFITTEIGMPTPQDRPAPFACDECEMVTEDVCGFIDNICNDLPDPGLFIELTNLAISFNLCNTIRNTLCVNSPAEDVCSETCVWPVP